MIEHHAASIKRRKSLIKNEKYHSVYPWEFPGMTAALVAKVRVDGSNPFARSNFINKINMIRRDVLRGPPARENAGGTGTLLGELPSQFPNAPAPSVQDRSRFPLIVGVPVAIARGSAQVRSPVAQQLRYLVLRHPASTQHGGNLLPPTIGRDGDAGLGGHTLKGRHQL